MSPVHLVVRLAATALCLPLLLSACATDLKNNVDVARAQSAEFSSTALTTSTTNQDVILAALKTRAGLGGSQHQKSDAVDNSDGVVAATEWDKIIDAGMEYADERCENYMAALFRINRDKKTIGSEIGLVGTATAGIMAAAKSTAREIALAAIAFGLTASTVDNLSGNLLYDLDPSSVRALVRANQAVYRDKLGKGYNTRSAAFRAIRNYVVLCVPANIEAEVNMAVKKAVPGSTDGNGPAGKPPEVSNAITTVESSFLYDANSSLLETFVKPNGAKDNSREAQLKKAMAELEVPTNVSWVSFLNTRKYEHERQLAVTKLKLAP